MVLFGPVCWANGFIGTWALGDGPRGILVFFVGFFPSGVARAPLRPISAAHLCGKEKGANLHPPLDHPSSIFTMKIVQKNPASIGYTTVHWPSCSWCFFCCPLYTLTDIPPSNPYAACYVIPPVPTVSLSLFRPTL